MGSPVTPESFAGDARLVCERLRRLPASAWCSRAEAVQALAQRLADSAAHLEGEPLRPLPRVSSPLVLPDQLAVVADDLVRAAAAAGPPGRRALEGARMDLGVVAGL
jgi:hypothetical protein